MKSIALAAGLGRVGSTLCLLVALFAAWLPSARAQQPGQTLILVARPQLDNPFFRESVVLVTRHGSKGPIGVILNRVTDIRYGSREEREDKTAPGRPLYFGGPVAPQTIVYVFKGDTDGEGLQKLLSLGDGLYLGTGADVFDEPLNHKPATELRVFIGFSAWSNAQLENEISRGDWLVLPFDPTFVFRQDVSGLWQDLVAKAGRLSI